MQKFSKSNSDNELKEAERIDILLQPFINLYLLKATHHQLNMLQKLLGLCDDAVRLPLVKIMERYKIRKLKNLLENAKLI